MLRRKLPIHYPFEDKLNNIQNTDLNYFSDTIILLSVWELFIYDKNLALKISKRALSIDTKYMIYLVTFSNGNVSQLIYHRFNKVILI
jgi:hypothetical protein